MRADLAGNSSAVFDGFGNLVGTVGFFAAVECVVLILGNAGTLNERGVTLLSGSWLCVMGLVVISFFVTRRTTEFLVTEKRVVFKSGVVTTQVEGIPLAQIETIRVDQGAFGKMFGYGTVVVKGTGGSEIECKDIGAPFLFSSRVQEQVAQDGEQPA
jgi:uncharacterized membrane protein YdbT with pleckstrin-like domain